MSELSYVSPFDQIRHTDEDGNEYWMARELAPLMGYTSRDSWRNFLLVIEKAKTSCARSGQSVEKNFVDLDIDRVGQRGPDFRDVQLSRYACYLTAMNADPRKPEVAEAQTYFAIQTRRAEVVEDLDEDLLQIHRLTLSIQQTRNEQRRLDAVQKEQGLALAKATERIADLEETSALSDSSDLLTLRDLAHACHTGQQRMKKWLMAEGIMFHDHENHDRIKQHPWVEEGLALDRWEKWKNGKGWSWVPYFTPRGVARIKRRYDKSDAA